MRVAESLADVLSASQLAARSLERRAVESAIWGMPIVSVDTMCQAFFRDTGGQYNDVAFLSKQADWEFQITTPNASSGYVYIPLNTTNGPVVLDLPPAVGAGLFASINYAWQKPEADVGLTGEDGGRGGKDAVLPPGYKEPVPADVFRRSPEHVQRLFVPPCHPANDFADGRGERAGSREEGARLSTHAGRQPPQQRHIDIAGKLFDGVAIFDDTFYGSLARIVDEEPVQRRDFVAMTHLRAIGIEKGKPFTPDTATRQIRI